MRLVAFLLAMIIAAGALAQEAPKRKAKKQQLAHKKPTPEQIRKFNELQKKKKD